MGAFERTMHTPADGGLLRASTWPLPPRNAATAMRRAAIG